LQKPKLNNLKNNIKNYVAEAQYNVFRVKQLATFGTILMLLFIFLITVKSMLDPETWSHFWEISLLYLMPPAGKETAIPLGLHYNIPVALLGVSIVFLDVLVAIGTLANWWIVELAVKYVPTFKIRNKDFSAKLWLQKLELKASEYRQRKRLKFIIPVTLFAFYLIPFQGGSISTAIIGTLLGYRWRTILFIIILASSLATLMWILTYYEIIHIL